MVMGCVFDINTVRLRFKHFIEVHIHVKSE